jgi:hypothetical protein
VSATKFLATSFRRGNQNPDISVCAAATVEQLKKKSSRGSITSPIPKQTDLPISLNIAPSQKVLTIQFNPETQQRSLDALQWGLIPHWAKDSKIAYRTINARAETYRTLGFNEYVPISVALPNTCPVNAALI